MQLGNTLPSIILPATGNKNINLADFIGRYHIVLYFYPRDNTPGCTQEGQDFRDNYAAFTALNTKIFGVSRDSIKKHEGFSAKYNFPFDLLADEDEQLCQLFAVMKNKQMFGKPTRGIERSTFLFDKQGFLRYEWRKVKVDNHVDEILAAIQTLEK